MTVVVEYMDGVIRKHETESAGQEEGCLVLRKAQYYGATPRVTHRIPLNNVREVQYR